MRNKILSVTSLIILGMGLSACSNTLQGVGQDVENAGETIQDTFD